ncbi:MAG TPA: hypothetical protein VFC60_03590 [Tissierellaceae bacterium]|nr:hypothetical protein [Tissierellaceae bacterium]
MVREEFIDAVRTGREIEFTCEGRSYFESHEADDKWYIYSERENKKQYFKSADDLINNALINGSPLSEMWYKIKIDYIL